MWKAAFYRLGNGLLPAERPSIAKRVAACRFSTDTFTGRVSIYAAGRLAAIAARVCCNHPSNSPQTDWILLFFQSV